MPIKFFTRDVVKGSIKKKGSKFTAFFITGNHKFVVTEIISDGVVFAELAA